MRTNPSSCSFAANDSCQSLDLPSTMSSKSGCLSASDVLQNEPIMGSSISRLYDKGLVCKNGQMPRLIDSHLFFSRRLHTTRHLQQDHRGGHDPLAWFFISIYRDLSDMKEIRRLLREGKTIEAADYYLGYYCTHQKGGEINPDRSICATSYIVHRWMKWLMAIILSVCICFHYINYLTYTLTRQRRDPALLIAIFGMTLLTPYALKGTMMNFLWARNLKKLSRAYKGAAEKAKKKAM